MKKIFYKTNQNNPQIRAYKEAVERGKRDHHVVYKDESWKVIRGGSERAIETFETQHEAIARAKYIAQNQGTSVYVHGVDGRIRETESYENDSYPPRNTAH
jgi:uncharacterized protein YdaT